MCFARQQREDLVVFAVARMMAAAGAVNPVIQSPPQSIDAKLLVAFQKSAIQRTTNVGPTITGCILEIDDLRGRRDQYAVAPHQNAVGKGESLGEQRMRFRSDHRHRDPTIGGHAPPAFRCRRFPTDSRPSRPPTGIRPVPSRSQPDLEPRVRRPPIRLGTPSEPGSATSDCFWRLRFGLLDYLLFGLVDLFDFGRSEMCCDLGSRELAIIEGDFVEHADEDWQSCHCDHRIAIAHSPRDT